jgi:hypothetical protein
MKRGSAAYLCALLVLAVAARADARKPEDVFAGKILVSAQPFPTQAKSASAYVAALKKNSTDRIQEDKENKQWRVFFAAFFKQPANDIEVSIRVYDVTNGARRLVDNFEQYLSSAATRAYVSDVKLKRGDGTQGYDPNSKLLMVMESKGRTLAQATFFIQGEAKKYKGVVDFSEEETKEGAPTN